MVREVVFDTETTGLRVSQGHRVIEVGCIEIINRRPTGHYFHRYLNPNRSIDEAALRVHGLSEIFLSDKPQFSEVFQELWAFLEGARLIAHNAAFDLEFLNAEILRLDKDVWMDPLGNKIEKIIEKKFHITDTLELARGLYPGQKNSLDALCKRFQIDNTHRQYHGALLDARLLADVYLKMTGGQTQLFSDVSSDLRPERTTEKQVIADYTQPVLQGFGMLKVQYATDSEKRAHERFVSDVLKG
jgi:DNA polymerase-3 subunit epsilon